MNKKKKKKKLMMMMMMMMMVVDSQSLRPSSSLHVVGVKQTRFQSSQVDFLHI